MSRLFISHSGKDKIAAIAFKPWLIASGWLDEDIFLDHQGVGAGERWKDALNRANARCEALRHAQFQPLPGRHLIMLPGMQRLEIGDPVESEQHGLPIDDELLMPVLARGLDDPRIAVQVFEGGPCSMRTARLKRPHIFRGLSDPHNTVIKERR